MFDGNWRETVNKGLDPIGASLRRAGVTADALTVAGIVIAGVGAVVIGNGYLTLGFVFLVLTGIPDALDGAVAKASGTSSVRGAFFDSVSDRLTDGMLFGGVAWYLASTEPGRIMMLPVAITLITLTSGDAKKVRGLAAVLLFSVCYGCSIAGIGTPSGVCTR